MCLSSLIYGRHTTKWYREIHMSVTVTQAPRSMLNLIVHPFNALQTSVWNLIRDLISFSCAKLMMNIYYTFANGGNKKPFWVIKRGLMCAGDFYDLFNSLPIKSLEVCQSYDTLAEAFEFRISMRHENPQNSRCIEIWRHLTEWHSIDSMSIINPFQTSNRVYLFNQKWNEVIKLVEHKQWDAEEMPPAASSCRRFDKTSRPDDSFRLFGPCEMQHSKAMKLFPFLGSLAAHAHISHYFIAAFQVHKVRSSYAILDPNNWFRSYVFRSLFRVNLLKAAVSF